MYSWEWKNIDENRKKFYQDQIVSIIETLQSEEIKKILVSIIEEPLNSKLSVMIELGDGFISIKADENMTNCLIERI